MATATNNYPITPTIITLPDGTEEQTIGGEKRWLRNGKLHREDGPAVIWAGGQEWFSNGKRHRDDGPAVVWTDGQIWWYLYGTRHEFKSYVRKQFSRNTPEATAFILKWS